MSPNPFMQPVLGVRVNFGCLEIAQVVPDLQVGDASEGSDGVELPKAPDGPVPVSLSKI